MSNKRKHPGRLGQKKNKWLFLILAFAIPFLGFLTVLLCGGCEPFGDNKAFLYSDEYHQYYPFFVNFRNALRSGDSLTYNWQIGMGVDYLGLVSYYLGSPLNLLSVLVPEGLLLEYFSILPAVRLGLAGLFFAIMLKKLYNKNELSISLFGSLYAMCAWAIAYQWNVMWLDTFALLPLVVLGTISLLRDKKVILYTVSLFFSIVCNYYIGLFTCIFVMLVSICYEICRCRSFKRLFTDFGRIAIFSALAIGMTAFLELPTVIGLGATQSSHNSFPTNFHMNVLEYEEYKPAYLAWDVYSKSLEDGSGAMTVIKNWFVALGQSIPCVLKGMKQVAGNMGGGIKPSFKEGLPNIYSGTCTIVMVFLFLTSGKVKLRDKICSVTLLVFFMVSFLLRQLDYLWHGFHFTNMIPYRFSFLFSFVMIWMAYRAWMLRDDFKVWQLVCAGVLTVGLLLLHGDFSSITFLGFNTVMVVLTMALFVFIFIRRRQLNLQWEESTAKRMKPVERKHRKMVSGLLAIVVGTELVLNLFSFSTFFSTTTVSNYPKGTTSAASAISYMKYRERNTLFYRAEVTHTQTYNDAALNNYNGITTFTSSANLRVTNFMRSLGYGAKGTYNRYAFEESSPVGNLFLNLKYMIERDGDLEENSYFDTIHNFGNVYLQENNAYLPLGFLAENDLEDWIFNNTKYGFYRQNELFRAATGLEEDVWEMSPKGCLNIISDDVELTSVQTDTGKVTYKSTSKGTITYCYFVPKSGFMCLEIDAPKKNSIRIYKEIDNVKTELYSETMSLPQMLSVAEVNAGEYVWLEIDCKKDEHSTIDVQAGVIKDDVFRQGYDILAASTLELTSISNTRVEGTIDCNRDGLLYTSIPYNGNWYAEVDGEEAELVLVGDCMVSLKLSKGQHNVVFRYENKAFKLGLMVSLVCLLVFVGLVLLNRLLLVKIGKQWEAEREAARQAAEAEAARLAAEAEAARLAAEAEAEAAAAQLSDTVTVEESSTDAPEIPDTPENTDN